MADMSGGSRKVLLECEQEDSSVPPALMTGDAAVSQRRFYWGAALRQLVSFCPWMQLLMKPTRSMTNELVQTSRFAWSSGVTLGKTVLMQLSCEVELKSQSKKRSGGKITWREEECRCRRLDSCTASCSFSRSTPKRTNRISLQQSQTFSDKSLAHWVINRLFAVMYLQTKYYNYLRTTYYYRYDVPWRCCRQLQRRGALWRQPELLHCPDVGAVSVYRSCCPCSTPKKHKPDCKWTFTVQGFKVFKVSKMFTLSS